MGALFYVSIGFNAADGVYYPNGHFVRPISEGAAIGGRDSFISAHFSPLLVSSISSSIIGVVSPLVMCLVAYHLSYSWLRASFTEPDGLPTPSQYLHTFNLVTAISLTSLAMALMHTTREMHLAVTSPRRSIRRSTSPILRLAIIGAITILAITWAIRVIDIILHDQITSTILYVSKPGMNQFLGRAVIEPACLLNTTRDLCPVINRTEIAMLGGLNQSSIFRVYEHKSSNPSRNRSVAFIGPADVESHTDINYTAHTYAASTKCEVFHPSCENSPHAIANCSPSKPTVDTDWNDYIWKYGFNTATWQMRLQTFLPSAGSLVAEPWAEGLVDTNGANINPFTTANFGCFSDYSSISYNNSDFETPFINWWTIAFSIPNQPYILCSISLCNTTVYDANYTLFNGSLSLDESTFSLASASAAIAVSGSALYLGVNDSKFYQWGTRFLDDQIQLDLSSAGNTYGNSTIQFAASWAQAFSNRYLGWSAGAIIMETIEAESRSAQLSVEIPLAPTYAFVVLHFVYAVGIIVLGTSCLVLTSREGRGWTGIGVVSRNFTAQDLRSAQQRLSDTSMLVHELSATTRRRSAEEPMVNSESDGETMVSQEYELRRRSSRISERTRLWEGNVMNDDMRVSMSRRNDGGLGIDFRKDK